MAIDNELEDEQKAKRIQEVHTLCEVFKNSELNKHNLEIAEQLPLSCDNQPILQEIESIEFFEKHNILELLLFFGIPQRDTNPIAHALLERFGSLSGVLDVLFMAVFSDWLGFNDKIIKLASNVFVVIFNYVASKLVIFKKH